jgi:ferredoxin-thioredoxin reductase catalytic subunit
MKTCEEFKSKNEEELRKDTEEYAQKAGIKVNPDEKAVEVIFKGLLKNKEMHGEVYCPCRIVTGDKEKDKEIICPCVFHRGEVEVEGHCKCLLFFGEKNSKAVDA